MNSIYKHAFLIIAHDNFSILEKQLTYLDHDFITIYIHIDKKVKNFPKQYFEKLCRNAKVNFVSKPLSVTWGGDSQVFCELMLLESGICSGCDYYHLISGVDLPIKTMKEFVDFFNTTPKYEYVSLGDEIKPFEYRFKKYHFFQNILGKNFDKISFISLLNKISFGFQRLLHINRKEKNVIYGAGSNWFSITRECANYILSRKDWIIKNFRFTICCDEVFLQTVITNSDFKKNLYKSVNKNNQNLRFVDWDRGSPYTFKIDDAELLLSQPRDVLFARKFSEKEDSKIIDTIYERIMI